LEGAGVGGRANSAVTGLTLVREFRHDVGEALDLSLHLVERRNP
jgi:hypothetical protein